MKSLTDNLQLIEVSAGSFFMGSGEGTFSTSQFESPRHRVNVHQPFEMSATPITQRQFADLMGYNPSHFHGGDQRPVENVTWHQAAAFCNALSVRAGTDPCFSVRGDGPTVHVTGFIAANAAKGAFRLPAEEEWEYACRAATTTAYWWGDHTEAIYEHAWWRNNAGDQTRPVAHPDRQNPWGFADMLGNVWEWCLNAWRKTYTDDVVDFDQRTVMEEYVRQDFDDLERVWRGGSWFCANSKDLRCAFRVNASAGLRSPSLGFRVMRCMSGSL